MIDEKPSRRVFLLRDLPAPLTRAGEHRQLFDNYIKNTKLRLRAERFPRANQWKWTLKNFSNPQTETEFLTLDEIAHETLKELSNGEIRKNRYALEIEGKCAEVDLFLGNLWGVCIAKVVSERGLAGQDLPCEFELIADITGIEFFFGENLATKTIDDVRKKVAELLDDSNKQS